MLSVVIPAYNEEKVISNTLTKIITFLDKKKIKYEIIVVDDGSKDKTREAVKKFPKVILTKERKNCGKGYSVKQGSRISKGDYILFTDADLSTPIGKIEKCMKYVNSYDIIIASRALKDSIIPVKQPFYRIFMGKTFNLFVQLFSVRGIKDTQCGFKLFNRKAVDIIFPLQRLNDFCFDVELFF